MSFLQRLLHSKHLAEQAFPEIPQPVAADNLRSVSVYCDAQSYQEIAAAYNALMPGTANWAVQHLNPVLEFPEVRQWLGQISMWKAIAAHIGREIIVSILLPVSCEEASMIPRIALGFSLMPSLGMVTQPNLPLFALKHSRQRLLRPRTRRRKPKIESHARSRQTD